MLSFEVIGSDQILTKYNGNDAEIIDRTSYQIYTEEKDSTIELIPEKYLCFLCTQQNTIPIELNLTPTMNDCMYPFQKKTVQRMISQKRCINAASMGLGKSVQALAAMYALRATEGDVIFCPGYLRSNWLQEVRRWCGDDYPVTVIKPCTKNKREETIRTFLMGKGLKIISYDMAANFFEALKYRARGRFYFNTVICDESHFLKERKTKRYQMLANTIIKARHCFLLTGTPTPNRNRELYSQLRLVNSEIYDNYNTFAKRYCNGHLDNFGRFDDRGSSCNRELSFALSKMVIRLRREDYLQDLPHIVREKLILSPQTTPTLFNKQMSQFNKLLGLVDEDPTVSFKLQTLASTMFRETAVIKQDPVLQYLQSYVAGNTEKTIFFCVHHNMIDAVRTLNLDNDLIVISGQTPMDKRTQLIDEFLSPEGPLYALLTIGSCSTGLNLVPISRMIFLELTWSPSELAQAECRINRIGGSKHLSYTYLVCENTLDERVFDQLKKKNQNAVDVVDGGKNYGDFSFHTSKKRKT